MQRFEGWLDGPGCNDCSPGAQLAPPGSRGRLGMRGCQMRLRVRQCCCGAACGGGSSGAAAIS
jgi:hypothetical protein